MKKKGYTLGEILIMLVFVGIIAILSIQTVKTQRVKYAFSCYYFYKNLQAAVGHMAATTIGGGLNSFSCEKALDSSQANYVACVAAGKASTANDYLLDYKTDAGFCKGLGYYLGTATKLSCTSFNDADLTSSESNIYGKIGAASNPATENFRLMNGYLIYISAKKTPTGSIMPYRIVSVDYNGKGGPNKKGEDIISFAIFDNGDVLPVGVAATDTNFFQMAIKIRNIMEMDSSSKQVALNAARFPTSIIKTSDKKSFSFKDAYCRVLGDSTAYPGYCNAYASFSEKFKMKFKNGSTTTTVQVPITICSQAQYNAAGQPTQTVNGKGFVADCEFNIIKPMVSKFIPIKQDVYSSKNNDDDISPINGEPNQIYKF